MRENHLIATVRLISIMLESIAAMIFGLMLLSTISGMLGLGVAFAAIPFLSIFFRRPSPWNPAYGSFA
ncbi:MAG: hypothetical protein QW437_06060 [Fervidicoccaceae archaeon]